MKASDIVKKALRSCYKKNGIIAGKTHFNYYWARDSFFASWGALEIKDYKIVRKNLENFLAKTKDNGYVPLRIGSSSIGQWLAIAGIKIKNNNKSSYIQDKGLNPALDPNLLLIITLDKYLHKTKDAKFAKKHLKKIKKILEWLEAREKTGLLYGGKYATWQDMIKKRGYVLYTNILYYQALVSLSNILKLLKIKNESLKKQKVFLGTENTKGFSSVLEKAQIIKNNINKKFWDKKKGYYIDFFDEKSKSKVFTSDGNFFAILFGVADKKQADSIIKKAERFGISKDVPSYTNYSAHEWFEKYIPFYLVGMQDYNDYGVCWTWIGCLHSMALSTSGKKKKAKEILQKLGKYIERDKEVYEVYDPKTELPLKRLVYKSEKSFAWTAGLYILAEKMTR
ncbi:hypothetical protein GOV08_03995 [Candidatus Woesearchaeota archaeon]|nr:hypothetical protein [Candidatus Woesearchaeota archaeon]